MAFMTVEKLTPGSSGIISEIQGDTTIRRRLMEMGVLPGSKLTLVKWAPLGDPAECLVRGYKLSLRRAEAALITVDTKKGEWTRTLVPLSLSKNGDKVVVRAIQGTGHLAKTLGQLGIIIGIELTIIQKAKESVIIRIGESRYALGPGAASMVLVEPQV